MISEWKSFEDLKKQVKEAGIDNCKKYRGNYNKYGFPAHPDRNRHWTSWNDFMK